MVCKTIQISTQPPTPTPTANIDITNIQVSDSNPNIGDYIQVVVTLYNSGNASGSASVSLYMNDQLVSTKTATVGSKSSKSVVFNTQVTTSGTNTIKACIG